jgi:integrase
MKRTRIGLGIYRTPYGYAVIWPDGGRNREKHFEPDTPHAKLTAYRAQQVKMARRAPGVALTAARSGFPRDVVRYLRTRKGRPCYKAERSHLKAWITRFGRLSRHAITPEAIGAALGDWRGEGKSPQTLRHRVNILRQLFHVLDPGQPTPCDKVKRPVVPHRRPQGVPDGIIEATALRLAEQERAGWLRDGKTRARFLVLATCGKRPCQLMRARPIDLDWAARVWHVEPAKNATGGPLVLNAEMFVAWQAFDRANAWGPYDTRSFAGTLRRNGWPAGVRPYRLRHQALQTLSNAGADFGAVQQMGGHASPDTTRRFYVPHELETSRRASAAIEGRFAAEVFAATTRHRTGIPIGGVLGVLGSPLVVPASGQPAMPASGPSEGPTTKATTKADYQGVLKTEVETGGNVRKIAPAGSLSWQARNAPRLVKKA